MYVGMRRLLLLLLLLHFCFVTHRLINHFHGILLLQPQLQALHISLSRCHCQHCTLKHSGDRRTEHNPKPQ
jgi:hypothetical protein